MSAGVVRSRAGAVRKSRVTFMDTQLVTEPTYGSVQEKTPWGWENLTYRKPCGAIKGRKETKEKGEKKVKEQRQH